MSYQSFAFIVTWHLFGSIFTIVRKIHFFFYFFVKNIGPSVVPCGMRKLQQVFL